MAPTSHIDELASLLLTILVVCVSDSTLGDHVCYEPRPKVITAVVNSTSKLHVIIDDCFSILKSEWRSMSRSFSVMSAFLQFSPFLFFHVLFLKHSTRRSRYSNNFYKSLL